jgi:hypothetical protein
LKKKKKKSQWPAGALQSTPEHSGLVTSSMELNLLEKLTVEDYHLPLRVNRRFGGTYCLHLQGRRIS